MLIPKFLKFTKFESCLRSSVERMGGKANENHAGSLFATVGASRHHDKCVRAHPSCCGEGHQKGDGSVCQQHHIRSLPVSQPAGACRAPPSQFITKSEKLRTIRVVLSTSVRYWSHSMLNCLVPRLQTSWTAMLLHSTRSRREKSSSWTHKALFSWCRSERRLLCVDASQSGFRLDFLVFAQAVI